MKRIAVWGAGNYFQKILAQYEEIWPMIEVVVDSNPEKWGNCFAGRFFINSPLKLTEDVSIIVVAIESKKAYEEILEWVDRRKIACPVMHVADWIKKYGLEKSKYNLVYKEVINELPIKYILERLQDEESKVLFQARLEMALTSNAASFYQVLLSLHRKDGILPISELYSASVNNDIISFMRNVDRAQPVILVGIDNESFQLICCTGIRIDAFLDGSTGDIKEYGLDIPKISFSECVANYKDAMYISGAASQEGTWRTKLISAGIPEDHFYRRHSCWRSQYFDEDFLVPDKNGIFVDAGVLDLNNSFDYIRWCNGDFKEIYAFEADEICYEKCQKRIENDMYGSKINLFRAAVWSSDTFLNFNGNSAGNNVEGERVPARSIDSVLQGKQVTYIKMDVEGAELEALKGAADTIRTWRPRMAICIYHKPKDIYELPLYILSLIPDYKFYIRHYATCCAETVLYCI